MKNVKSIFLKSTLASALLMSTSIQADDTDIYLNSSVLSDLGLKPNMLFVFDTSGSMNWDVNGIQSNEAGYAGESRLDILKSAMTTILNDADLQDEINVGMMRFNGNEGAVIYPMTELTSSNAAGMITRINDITANGSTPVVPTYMEGVRYLMGEDVVGGLSRPGDNRYYRISVEGSLVSGTYEYDDPGDDCDSTNPNDSDCGDEHWQSPTGSPLVDPQYNSPIVHQCQKNHIVLLTDGSATRNSTATKDAIKELTGLAEEASCDNDFTNEDGDSVTVSGSQECGIELADYLANEDIFDDDNTRFPSNGGVNVDQNVITHTLAFALNNQNDIDWLTKLAGIGGGTFTSANSEASLVTALEGASTSALEVDTTFVAPTATVNQFNRLNHRDDIYFALYSPATTTRWDGNVKKFGLYSDGAGCSTTGENNVICGGINGGNTERVLLSDGTFNPKAFDAWSTTTQAQVNAIEAAGGEVKFEVTEGGAASQLASTVSAVSPRPIYTWLSGSGSSDLTNSVNALTYDDPATPAVEGNITNTHLGDATTDDLSSLLNWVKGHDVLDFDGNATTTGRKQYGDPLHSRPVVSTFGYTNVNDKEGTAQLAMFFGTNEGYFHAANGSTGEEIFSFMPEEMLPKANALKTNSIGSHIYGVDGPITIWSHDYDGNDKIDGSDFVYAYFGFRRGGNSYYALDVTSVKNSFSSGTVSPTVLWRITPSTTGFEELGDTWAKPVKTRIRYDDGTGSASNPNYKNREVLLFSGGYDDSQDDDSDTVLYSTDSKGTAIYMVDAVTGDLLWKVDSGDLTDMKYSIPSTLAVVDVDGSGHADQVYVGDMGGQVWRFDIKNGEPLTVGSATAYTNSDNKAFVESTVIATLGGTTKANSRRFYHTPDVALIKESGTEKIVVTIGSGWRAKPNDEEVDDRFYMLKVPAPYGALSSVTFSTLTESDLLPVSDVLDPDPATLLTYDGWYIDMEQGAGEKIMSTPLTIDGKVTFVSYEPETDLVGCSVKFGIARAYFVNILDGSPIKVSGTLDKTDRFDKLEGGTIVDEPVVIFTKDGGGSVFYGPEKGDYEISHNRATRTFWFKEN